MRYTKETIFDALETSEYDLKKIFCDEEKLNQIRTNDFYKPYIEDLVKKGDEYFKEPIEALQFSKFIIASKTGNREIFQKEYFRHRYRLNIIAILAWLYPDNEKYIAELEDIIWAICDEYTWALPAHISGSGDIRDLYPVVDKQGFTHDIPREDDKTLDLFGTETGSALAEITTIFENKLHPKVVYRARKLVNERVLQPFLNNICFWEDLPMNWCSVCSSNIGMAALYLIKDNPTLTLYVRRIIFNLNTYLTEGFKKDGTTTEGLKYWYYGFSRFTCFAELLARRTNHKIELLKDSDISEILKFPERSTLHNCCSASFADNTPELSCDTIGVTAYLKQYSSGMPIWITSGKNLIDGNGSFETSIRNLLWTNPNDIGKPSPNATYILPYGNWVVSRGENKAGFATKGGSNNETHNHNDVGNIIYQGGKDFFFYDLGQGEYTLAYFTQSTRYTFLCTSSRGHCVPIIDGKYQVNDGDTSAKNFFAEAKDNSPSVSMDIQDAYQIESLDNLNRKIDFNFHNGDLKIVDTFKFNTSNHEVIERFVSKLDAKIDESKNQISIKGAEKTVYINYDPKVCTPRISYEEFTNHYCIVERATFIDFICKVDKELTVNINCSQVDN